MLHCIAEAKASLTNPKAIKRWATNLDRAFNASEITEAEHDDLQSQLSDLSLQNLEGWQKWFVKFAALESAGGRCRITTNAGNTRFATIDDLGWNQYHAKLTDPYADLGSLVQATHDTPDPL